MNILYTTLQLPPLLPNTTTTNTTNTISNTSLSWKDVILEGIDFHCDHQLIPYLLSRLSNTTTTTTTSTTPTKTTNTSHTTTTSAISEMNIKSTIWLFRSSINTHKLWSIILSGEEEAIYQQWLKGQCKEKQQLAIIWKYICTLLREYSQSKLTQILKRS